MKVEVKEAQSNDVDWTKNPQLVKYEQGGEYYIVLTSIFTHGDNFEGTIVSSNIEDDSTFFIGRHKESLVKSCFKPFHGEITLKND